MLGWREWAGFPEWGVTWVKAKVDTGARTSALHADRVEHLERDGAPWVRFVVRPWQGSDDDAVEVETPVVDRREVTSSSGERSDRVVVATPVRIGTRSERVGPIEITLSQREDLGFRMLLGREAVRGRFVVDPARSYLAGRPSRAVRRRNRGRE